jgi:hypothetical protein
LAIIKASDISHFDIVVEVDTIARTSKRIIHLDTEGYIDQSVTWKIMDDEKGKPEGTQSEFFCNYKTQKPQ